MRERLAVEKSVREALTDLGFAIDEQPDGRSAAHIDLLARRGQDSYFVEIKSQVPFRRAQFLGAVAHGILELRAQQQSHPSWKPLLAVWAEKVGPNAAPEFEAYVSQHAPHLDWLMVDASGWRKWKIGDQAGEQRGEHPERSRPVHAAPTKSNPFAPRHQWMLKLLLMAGLDRKYWSGPEQQPESVSALAVAARVAKSHAWNLVALLDQRGYLRREGRRFQFPGLRRLLEDWCAFVRLRPDKAIGAVSIYPERSVEKALVRVLARLRAPRHAVAEPGSGEIVLGGHHACDILGLGRSNIHSVRLYAEGIADALNRLELVPAEGGSALLEIVEPKARQSVFEGSVRVNGLGVADVLQLYLDLRSSPARGVEQSDFLFERVLEPHFRRSGWL